MSPLVFSKDDPFPLLPPDSHRYEEAQAHSAEVDAWLGLSIQKAEYQLKIKLLSDFEKREQWVGLDPAALLTPYTEIRHMLNLLNLPAGSHVVDLGAAYGRMAFVMGTHFPDLNFTGFELSKERVFAAKAVLEKFNFKNVKLIEQDLSKSNFILPEAQVYFIYDFGTLNSIIKVLMDIQEVARKQKVILVGRGRAVRDQIERKEPWLTEIVAPEHHGRFSVYRTG